MSLDEARRKVRQTKNGVPVPSANGHTAQKPWEIASSRAFPAGGWNAADLVCADLPAPKYAVDGLLVEGLTLLGGRPKQGKSWLALLIAWAVAGGYELDGRKVQRGNVLYLALEDTPRRLKKRLLALNSLSGWDVPVGLTLHTDWPRADDGGLYFVAQWLEAQKGAAQLVIVDTLAKFRPPQKGGNNYAEDYSAVGDIQKLCGHFEVSSLTVTHTRKLHAEDPFDELSGTLGVTGAADSLWVLERTRGDAGGELFVTGRDLPDSTIPMTFSAADCRWKFGTSKDGIDTAARTVVSPATGKLEQCKEWLKDFLNEYAYPSKEIDAAGKVAGFALSTIRDAKAALGSKGTGEVTHKNFGYGGDNDWWSGIGHVCDWKRRPVLEQRRESGESENEYSQDIPP